MLQRIRNLLFLLISLFFLNSFRCENFEEIVPLYTLNWQGAWVDNSGASPVLNTGPVNRAAAGIRLSAQLSNDGQNPLPVNTTIGSSFSMLKTVQKIQFFTLTGFDGLSVGTDITDRFRTRVDYRDGSALAYTEVNSSSLDYFLNNSLPAWAPDYYADFLLTSPPSLPGLLEVAVTITFDSTTVPPVDTSLNVPAILLQ